MFRRFVPLALLLAFLSVPLGPSAAQTAPDDDPDEVEEPARPQGPDAAGPNARADQTAAREAVREAVRRRVVACRRDAARRNLRGEEARDALTICLAEARLDCLKKAVEARVSRGPERQSYINRCLGET